MLYAHTDKAGVVYYAKYLEFFEAARTEYLRALGKSYADFEREGLLLTVVEAQCRYLAPAEYDDLLTVQTWIPRLRRTRIDFAYRILRSNGTIVCEGSTVLACLDAENREPRALPPEICALIEGKV